VTEREPKILALLCSECSYAAADDAGGRHLDCPPGLRVVRLPCTGRIDLEHIVRAYAAGADGVIILGCHPGDCRYRDGNTMALRRTILLRYTLEQLQIPPERLEIDWVAAREGQRFAHLVNAMRERLIALETTPRWRSSAEAPGATGGQQGGSKEKRDEA
jgi:F420-non-reducing hydrogenase iron-sulfur subunit